MGAAKRQLSAAGLIVCHAVQPSECLSVGFVFLRESRLLLDGNAVRMNSDNVAREGIRHPTASDQG